MEVGLGELGGSGFSTVLFLKGPYDGRAGWFPGREVCVMLGGLIEEDGAMVVGRWALICERKIEL